MVNDFNDFEKQFTESFGDINRTTLSEIQENRLRLELGADRSDLGRIMQASSRSKRVLQYCFQNLPFWLRIILWSESEEKNLEQAGLTVKDADIVFRHKSEDEVLYLYFEKYSNTIANSVITSIVNYEMAEEPSANVTCYFINFERSLIINIYDDRGMDIYSPEKSVIEEISNRFSTWRVKD